MSYKRRSGKGAPNNKKEITTGQDDLCNDKSIK